ncbi:MAG: YceI family protein [Gammaproteobacteria bacterium]
MSLRIAAGCALLLCATGAGAAGWTGDGKAGRLEFTALQAGAHFTGRFREFRVELEFDATAPAKGWLHVSVATASEDTQDDDRDGILKSQDFFWSERHPEAVFQAEGFNRSGNGWDAHGTLTLRGVSQPLVVHFTAMPVNGGLKMKGGAKLSRLAFGVGQGDWASTEWIGDEVAIAFEVNLKRAPTAASP